VCVPDRGRSVQAWTPRGIGQRIIAIHGLRDADDPGEHTQTGYLGVRAHGGFASSPRWPSVNAICDDSTLTDRRVGDVFNARARQRRDGCPCRPDPPPTRAAGRPGASAGLARRAGAHNWPSGAGRGDRIGGPEAQTCRCGLPLAQTGCCRGAPENLRAALGDEKITVLADMWSARRTGRPCWSNRARRTLTTSGANCPPDCGRWTLRTATTCRDPDLSPESTIAPQVISKPRAAISRRRKFAPTLAPTIHWPSCHGRKPPSSSRNQLAILVVRARDCSRPCRLIQKPRAPMQIGLPP